MHILLIACRKRHIWIQRCLRRGRMILVQSASHLLQTDSERYTTAGQPKAKANNNWHLHVHLVRLQRGLISLGSVFSMRQPEEVQGWVGQRELVNAACKENTVGCKSKWFSRCCMWVLHNYFVCSLKMKCPLHSQNFVYFSHLKNERNTCDTETPLIELAWATKIQS